MYLSCTNPMVMIWDGSYTAAGKKRWKMVGSWTQDYEDAWIKSSVEREHLMKIPCGQCIECRLAKSRQWADRMLLELKYHDEAYFVTLTYDEEHVPRTYSYDENGECVSEVMSLQKSDFQKFMKRLRFNHDETIRFYACGEYGSNTKRPHYHAIIFGLHIDDKELVGHNELGQNYYKSHDLEEIWNNGFVTVADVTWETCAYVARYVTKKLTGKLGDFYEIFNLEPEFSLMSRRPGIARQYFEDHKDEIYKYDTINIAMKESGRKMRPPAYYDRLFDAEYTEMFADIKDIRKESDLSRRKMVNMISELNLEDRNEILDRQAQNHLNRLIRNKI